MIDSIVNTLSEINTIKKLFVILMTNTNLYNLNIGTFKNLDIFIISKPFLLSDLKSNIDRIKINEPNYNEEPKLSIINLEKTEKQK